MAVKCKGCRRSRSGTQKETMGHEENWLIFREERLRVPRSGPRSSVLSGRTTNSEYSWAHLADFHISVGTTEIKSKTVVSPSPVFTFFKRSISMGRSAQNVYKNVRRWHHVGKTKFTCLIWRWSLRPNFLLLCENRNLQQREPPCPPLLKPCSIKTVVWIKKNL